MEKLFVGSPPFFFPSSFSCAAYDYSGLDPLLELGELTMMTVAQLLTPLTQVTDVLIAYHVGSLPPQSLRCLRLRLAALRLSRAGCLKAAQANA